MSDKRFDNDTFRFLQDGTATPPSEPHLWNKLEEQLDWPAQMRGVVGTASYPPPPGVWEALEAELDDKQPVFIYWHKIAAAVLLLVLLGGAGVSYYFFSPEQTRITDTKRLSPDQQERPQIVSEPSVTDKPLKDANNSSTTEKPPTLPPAAANQTPVPTSGQQSASLSGNEAVGSEPNTMRISLLVPLAYVSGPVGNPKLFHLEKRTPTEAPENANSKTNKTSQKQWFIWIQGGGGEFRPNYGGDFGERSVGVVPADGDNLREVLTGSVKGTARSYGGELGRYLGKRWLLTTGLYYIRSNYTVHTNFYRDISSSDLQSGSFRVEYESQFQHQQEWISVPLTLGYRIGGDKRLDALVQGGFSTDLMLGERRIDIYPEYHYDMGQTNGAHLNGLLGAQLRYALLPSQRLRMVVSGRYERTLGSQLEAQDVQRSPERYQLGVGLQWDF